MAFYGVNHPRVFLVSEHTLHCSIYFVPLVNPFMRAVSDQKKIASSFCEYLLYLFERNVRSIRSYTPKTGYL